MSNDADFLDHQDARQAAEFDAYQSRRQPSGLSQHPYFERLAIVLGSEPLALGVLKFLWQTAFLHGHPRFEDDIAVAIACHWRGDPAVLTKALLEAGGPGRPGFLDLFSGGGYVLLDYEATAPSLRVEAGNSTGAR